MTQNASSLPQTEEQNMDPAVHTANAQILAEGFPLIMHLQPVVEMTDDQFFEFCQINRDLRIERAAQGELLIMPPPGGETGERNAEISMQLRLWAKRDGTGTTL